MASPSSELLDALGLNQGSYQKLDSASQASIQRIQDDVNGLSSSDQKTLLTQLQQLQPMGAQFSLNPNSQFSSFFSQSLGQAVSQSNNFAAPKYAPTKDLLGALSLTQQQYDKLDAFTKGQIQSLDGYLGQTNSNDYKSFLSQLSSAVGANAANSRLTGQPSQINQILNNMSSQIYGTVNNTTYQANIAANQPSAAQPLTGLGNVSGSPSQQDYQYLQTLVPGFSNPQGAYQDYVNNLKLANTAATQQGKQPAAVPSESQWFQQQVTNIKGPYQPILQALNAQYMLEQGTNMPADLEAQVIAQINQMPQDAKNQLTAALPNLQNLMSQAEKNPTSGSLTTLASALSGLGFNSSSSGPLGSVYQTFNEYVTTSPSQFYEQDLITGQNVAAWRSALGTAPTPDQIQEMSGMSQADLQNYINSQTVPGTKVSYGTYSTALGELDKQFTAAGLGTPSRDQIQQMSGWTPEQIDEWTSNQKSPYNSDFTVGERQSYLTAADKWSQSLFGAPADDRMASLLKQEISTPGK